MREPPAALRKFLAPYGPAIARVFLATRKVLLTAAPDATELIYDAYNAVAVAYSFTDRLSEAFCHVAAYRHHVNLGFNQGARLPDPQRLLLGTGANIRHIRIVTVDDLQRFGVRCLVHAAVEQGRRLNSGGKVGPPSIVKATYGRKRRPPSTKR